METRTTIRTVCQKGRISFHPEWNKARPWASYIDGTAGQYFAQPSDAEPYFARRGMTFETPMQTMQRMAALGHRVLFRAMASGGRWHLYRRRGTDTVIIVAQDDGDEVTTSPEWAVMVADVQAMTEASMVLRMADVVKGHS